MTDPLMVGLLAFLGITVLLGIARGTHLLFYQGSTQQRFDNLFTGE